MPANVFIPDSTVHFVPPGIPDVERIAAISDPVLRNLQITQCYWELSKFFETRLAGSANWCTFATWASRQAGQSIRGEDLQRTMENLLKKESVATELLGLIVVISKRLGSVLAHDQIIQAVLISIIKCVTDKAGDAVARGNKKVFEEIGREFARFISTCFADSSYDEESVSTFCSLLKPGEPPEGQVYLNRAFKRYYASFFVSDKMERDQLCLLANIEIGFHEQTRLQPEIAESLNSAIIEGEAVKDHLKKVLFPATGIWARLARWLQDIFGRKSLLDKAVERLLRHVEQHMHKIITEHLMTLTIPPDKCLRLGKDLDASFPIDLQKISNADLLAMLASIDPTPDSLSETAATDWADLKERLHYIADLFRCYQCEANLFLEVFSAEQLIVLKNGKVPEGRL